MIEYYQNVVTEDWRQQQCDKWDYDQRIIAQPAGTTMTCSDGDGLLDVPPEVVHEVPVLHEDCWPCQHRCALHPQPTIATYSASFDMRWWSWEAETSSLLCM